MKQKYWTMLLSVGVATLTASYANAGGLERGGYNIDLLFDPAPVTVETAVTYVNPQRELNDVVDTDASDGTILGTSDGVRDTESYWVPRIGFKASIGEAVDCLVDYSQPWGVHSAPGSNWAGAQNNIETKVESDGYSATCSYKFQAGKGQFRVLGGVFYQELEGFKERLVAPIPAAFGSGVGRLELEDDGIGWRIGAAYEIPEIALRASLVYNSEVKLDDVTGTLDLTNVPYVPSMGLDNPLFGRITDVFGEATMPQSVEFKLQSGIAPDWLAFGSVKWTDWSVMQSIPFCPTAFSSVPCTSTGPTRATSLDLLYRDGWTVSGGVGHRFNDQWSAAVSLTWDRGTSDGLGYQSDTWTLGGGVGFTPTKHVELRLAGALGVMTSGSSGEVVGDDGVVYGDDVSYTYDDDVVSALSASLKVKW